MPHAHFVECSVPWIGFALFQFFIIFTGNGKVTVDDLDPSKCTIYIYAFATLNEHSLTMEPFDQHLDIDLKVREKPVVDVNSRKIVVCSRFFCDDMVKNPLVFGQMHMS